MLNSIGRAYGFDLIGFPKEATARAPQIEEEQPLTAKVFQEFTTPIVERIFKHKIDERYDSGLMCNFKFVGSDDLLVSVKVKRGRFAVGVFKGLKVDESQNLTIEVSVHFMARTQASSSGVLKSLSEMRCAVDQCAKEAVANFKNHNDLDSIVTGAVILRAL